MRVLVLTLLVLAAIARAETTVFESHGPVILPRTEQLHFTSPVNGVEYRLLVSIPRDFDTSDARHPVLYLLDADYSFAIARNVVEHLVDRGDLPPLVVVSIGYAGEVTQHTYRMHRSRDYTPVASDDAGYGPEYRAVTGGGPAFLRTIEEHIVPGIEARFRGNGERVLVGHSYGGLFAVWAWLTRPDLFDTAIAVSPSLWFDGHRPLQWAEEATLRKGQRLYAMVGDREINQRWNMVDDLRRLEAILADAAAETRIEVADDETHNSIFPRAMSNGLRWIWPRGTF